MATAANENWPFSRADMARYIRERDWSETSLGPAGHWPALLRSTVEMLLSHGFPMIILWGRDLLQIYNDGYADLMVDKHPSGLGISNQICWPEVWHINELIYGRVFAGETVTIENGLYPLVRHGVRQNIWLSLTYSPIIEADGSVAGVLVTIVDTTRRMLAEAALEERGKQLNLVVAELQHRVRNILTVVRSIFSRSVETGTAFEEIADHFRGRLDALARVQVIVTQSADGTADFENLLRDELVSVGVQEGPNLEINGPDVRLPSDMFETMGLAIHELTTNAVKYGAFKVETGKLSVTWQIERNGHAAPILSFLWREEGVPAIDMAPRHEGFGRELIEEAIPYRLGGSARLEFLPGGVQCSIIVPLPDGNRRKQPLSEHLS
ncbi:sensor histidine kinase [Sphingomonas bisphenolicum]|nr:sensor histidine kinase [Sphingomonas bisphenolicum]